MIKVKDGYAKLIGTTYSGSASRLLLSDGGDKAVTDFAASSHNHSAGNITSGTLPVARGGTGATTFTSGAALIGNGTGAVTTRSITSSASNGSTDLITSGGVYTALSGKMTANPTSIELNYSGSLKNYGGFIDFHFYDKDGNQLNSSGEITTGTVDYTSRIIEDAAGRISINGVKFKGNQVTASGGFVGDVTGNSSTATKLKTARTIALTGSVTGSGTFDGSGNLSISTTTNHTHAYAGASSAGGTANAAYEWKEVLLNNGVSLADYHDPGHIYYAGGSNNITDLPENVDAFGMYNIRCASGWFGQILLASNKAPGLYYRAGTSTGYANGLNWKTILDSSNYTSYTVKKDGTGASGNWGINITGSAGHASTVTVETGYANAYRGIVVTNGSNSLFTAGTGAGKPQYNYSTGDIKAYSFTTDGGNFIGTATAASTVSVTACRSSSNSKKWDDYVVDTLKLKVWDVYNDGGPSTYGNILEINGISDHWKPQLWFDAYTGQMRVRNRDYNATKWNAWRIILDGSNYTSYTVKKDGTGASGTWGINITGSAGSVPWTGVSGRPTKLSEFTNDEGFITNDHNHDSRYLQKVTYEWNKELALGSAHTGKVCIGKFPMYDSNIVINVNSTTNNSFHGTLVIATQNINTSGGGTKNCVVYGDATNEFTNSIRIKYVSGSNVFSVYCNFPKWSKNLVHIKAMALAGTPTDIVTAIDAIPSDATILPTNALITNFAAKSHTHTRSEITDFDSHNHDSDYLKKSGGQLNTGATLKFDTYGTRFLTISGNAISADMSADTGTWAGAFATVKSTQETTTMLGWYGSYSGGLTHIFMGGTYNNPAMKMTPAGVFTFANTIQGNISGSAGSVHWNNVTNKPTSFTPSAHSHTYIAALDTYTFDSSELPNSFSLGASCGFVSADSGFGSYGSVLTVRTYSGGGGTLQLYAPYSPAYGGTRLKARFGNYNSSNGNSWTDLQEIAWRTDIPTKVSQLENDSAFITTDYIKVSISGDSGTLNSSIKSAMVANPHKVVFNRETIWYYAENLSSSMYYYTSQNVVYNGNQIQKHCLNINPTSGAWTYAMYTYSPTESDTLATVTSRGNTTTTAISTAGLTSSGPVKIGDCTLQYDSTNKYLRFTFS